MLLIVDKPKGYTSFNVIKKLKRLYPKTKIGHSGTLDPMATGVLVIGIGPDTKKLTHILSLDKVYTTTIDFSKLTDTFDMDYWEKIEEYEYDKDFLYKDGQKIPKPSLDAIKLKLDMIIPEYQMPLPMFSAKKVGGKKLYDLARNGENLNLKKVMNIYSYEILDYNFPYLSLRVTVGSGTYIRSIGYWLGQELGLGGTLCELRRESIGDYKL